MPYNEFCSYLSGLMEDTPLGRIVSIRLEDNKETLKTFSPEQKKIRSEWQIRNAKSMDKKAIEDVIESFKNMFKSLAEGGV